MKKTALILEGGSFRTMFSAGVLDVFLENEISFDYVIGVSAGALVAINYLSKQKGRVAYINTKYNNDKRYIGLTNYFQSDGVINFDFLFEYLGNGDETPFDYNTFGNRSADYEVVVTNCETGKAEYFLINDNKQEMIDITKASGSLPLISKEINIDNVSYLDGGIADSIPIQHVLDLGFEKIVVILTQDRSFTKKSLSKSVERLLRLKYRNYPSFLSTLKNRHFNYNNSLKTVHREMENGKVYLIQPDRPVKIEKIEKDKTKLESLYKSGLSSGAHHANHVKSFLKE